MLRTLDIRDILIIDHLALDLGDGLNVLTGETGAGKSILLDALGFVLGWRGRAELVRQGAAQGEVTAIFDLAPDHPARAVLREAGLPEPEEQLLLRRTNTASGRKSAWINGRPATGEQLRALSDTLVELHGQHDDRGLLNPRGHRALLDAFAGHDDLLTATTAAWRALAEARTAREQAAATLDAARAEEDFLRHTAAELDSLDPQPGEEAELDARRRLMQGAARIGEDISRAAQALGSDGAEGRAGDALRWLEDAAADAGGTLDAPLAALSRALSDLAEASDGVARALDTLAFDPHELEITEERLFAIRALARKHQVAPDALGEFAEEMRARLAALDQGDAALRDATAAEEAARAAYAKAASALSASRADAARRLDTAVAAELAPLKMDRAVFSTELGTAPDGPEGTDAVQFLVATNPGAPAGPIGKIASGGELSRFLLALKVCLARATGGVTMIFDEIDRGVGGATADAVGRRLAALARDGQVLVVTHSPQVAALGNTHLRVEKRVEGEVTLSTVTPLSDDDRIDEVARMLAGDTVTPEARAAAKSLLSA
ncbi:DNA repair protein RecN [Pseudaestuariivita atlantica]|uniref:DNA repair protein RecN n=1 Tax=Pseudaestuariivita atlantica TaxID=1317121 RepID=A0A0L1JTU0_9RHOB|nr:DNA repair protein RecN [Pseudaestuariivita atlantica]KNG95165.1 DNA recombination protein RecN [Pseudaestuariivita atlantica]